MILLFYSPVADKILEVEQYTHFTGVIVMDGENCWLIDDATIEEFINRPHQVEFIGTL